MGAAALGAGLGGGLAMLAVAAWAALACAAPIAVIGGLGALGLAVDRALSRRAGLGPVVVGAAPATGGALSPTSAAARQRELAGLDRDLTDQDWLTILALLRDGVSADGVYHLLRLRHASRRRYARRGVPGAARHASG